MANANFVHLIGRLTKDPVLRFTQTNKTPVTEVTLAINREFTVSDGSRKKEACFVDIVFWARKAEIVALHLRTGSQIYVQGRLENDTWEGQDGTKRSRIRVVGENFQFLDRRRDDDNGDDNGDEEWDEAAAGVSEKPETTD